MLALQAEFPHTRRAPLPYKRAAERAFPGGRGRNGLIGTRELGTRVCIQALVSDCFEPDEPQPEETPCDGCDRCERACPVGAIHRGALDANRCLRSFLSGGIIPDEIKARLPALLGCEICQRVCPRNAHVRAIALSQEIRDAFGFETLLSPGASLAKARELVGSNISAARLRSQAIILAAHEGGYDDMIAAFLDSDNETIRDAAAWALEK